MPIFELQTPDGKNFEVDAPDMQSAAGALGSMKAPSSPQQIGTGEDVAKSAATGVEEGGIGLGGALGDIQSLADKGVGWAAQKLGYDPAVVQGTIKAAQQVGGRAPTSQQITDTAKSVGVPFHEPQTALGQAARTAGQFLPASMLGPGSMGAKLTTGAAGAAGSEIAGDVAKQIDPAAEPYARFAGGVLGGGGAYAAATRPGNIIKQVAKEAPEAAAVGASTDQMYDQLRNAGIRYHPEAYQKLADDVSVGAVKDGFRKAQAPLSFDIIDQINSARGLTPDFSDIDGMRKSLGKIMGEESATNTDKELAGRIRDTLDTFAETAPIAPGSKLSAPEAAQLAGQAREMARRNILSRDVDEMMRKAQTYQSGYAAGIRNQFSNYLRSSRGKRLTPEEQQVFMGAAKGNFNTKVLNYLGKFGFDVSHLGSMASALPSVVGGELVMHGEPVTAAGLIAAGTAARHGERMMMGNLAKRAQSVLLAGKPGQQAIRIANSNQKQRLKDIMARTLLSGTASQAAQPQDEFKRRNGQ